MAVGADATFEDEVQSLMVPMQQVDHVLCIRQHALRNGQSGVRPEADAAALSHECMCIYRTVRLGALGSTKQSHVIQRLRTARAVRDRDRSETVRDCLR